MFPLRLAPAAPHLPPSRAACRPSGRPSAGPAWLGLLLATLGVTLGFAAPSRPSASTEVRRPNVLWVVSEDNTATFTGPYGDPLARTPTIDRLATQGIVFTHAYTAPVCAPSRSGIITGRYAHGLGSQHMRSTRPLPADATFFPTYLRNAGYYCTNNRKTDYNTSTPWDTAWDRNGPQAHWRGRAPGQPFFAVFNFEQSHESSLHSRRTLVTDPARVKVRADLPDTPEVRADIAQYYDNVSLADAAVGRILAQLDEDGLAEDTIVFYYSDNGGAVAGTKRFLSENGTHIAFVARFPAAYAHLAPSAPGTRVDEPIHLVDLAPTMLRLAGLEPATRFDGRAFAGLHRDPAPEFVFMGRDRMDECYDLIRAVTDGRYRYIRNYHPERPLSQYIEYLYRQSTMRVWRAHFDQGRLNSIQRRFFEPRPPEELYDVTVDPDTVHNRADDPALREVRDRMRAALRTHQLQVRDTGLLPEAMMVSLAAGASPTVPASDDTRYPLARLLSLVDAAQLGADPSHLADAARDPLAVVRYWAVCAAGRITADHAAWVERLLRDPDGNVRIAAAETLLHAGPHPLALTTLAAVLQSAEIPELHLEALNVLARTQAPIPPELQTRLASLAADRTTTGMEDYVARAAKQLLTQPSTPRSEARPASRAGD